MCHTCESRYLDSRLRGNDNLQSLCSLSPNPMSITIVEGFLGETKPATFAYIDVREERRQVSTTKSPTRLIYAGSLLTLIGLMTFVNWGSNVSRVSYRSLFCLAALTVFLSKKATVIGPTPPGTGDIYRTLSTTFEKSTSPTILSLWLSLLIPTSITID